MSPVVVADVLVNLFAAAGLAIAAVTLRRDDPRGALTRRIVWALGVAGLLFLVRSLAWATDAAGFDRSVAALASLIPLCSLLVTEGILRRHAPVLLKAIVAGASVVMPVLHLTGLLDGDLGAWLLMAHVVGGFLAVIVLMLTRDRAALTGAENRTIGRLVLVTLVLAALAATDFRSVLPDIPVRIGALGAMVLLYVSLSPEGLSSPGRVRVLALALWTVIAIVLALGAAAIEGGFEVSRMVRVAAVALAGLILAALVSEHLALFVERRRPASALLAADGPEGFRRGLIAHPLLAESRILEGDALADVEDDSFRQLLAAQPILRRSKAPWGRPATDDGVERARSLLEAHDASHIAALSLAPLRLLVLSLPSIATDPRAEGEIEVARRIGEIVFAGEPGCRQSTGLGASGVAKT